MKRFLLLVVPGAALTAGALLLLPALWGGWLALCWWAFEITWILTRTRTMWVNPDRRLLRALRCKVCDGCTILWLDPADSTWKMIPRELRVFDSSRQQWALDESRFPGLSQTDRIAFNTGAPLANTHKCHHCAGLGHHWDYPRWRSDR